MNPGRRAYERIYLGLLVLAQLKGQQQPCQSIAGNTWVEDDGSAGQRTFTLQQNDDGTFQGSTYKESCQSPYWDVNGTMRPDGTFTLTATNPSPEDTYCSAPWFTDTGSVNGPGCDSISASWVNGNGMNGDVQMTKQCDVPYSEIISNAGWGDNSQRGNFPTLALFQQFLSAPVNLGGRVVNESFPVPGQDSCWFPDSPYAYQSSPVPASWPVGFFDFTPSPTNTWAYDYIGWYPEPINWYRQNRPAYGFPVACGFSIQQRMNISCSGGTNFYQGNYLEGDMDVSSLSSVRSDASAYRNWP